MPRQGRPPGRFARHRHTRLLLLAGCGWLCASFAAAVAPASAEFSYIKRGTDQLGVPGLVEGTALTDLGDLFTGYGELSLRVGRPRIGFPSGSRVLDAGRYPVLTAKANQAPVEYTQTVLTTAVGGRPVNFVRVEMHNTSNRPVTGHLVSTFSYNGGGTRRLGSGFYKTFRTPRPFIPVRPGLLLHPGDEFDPATQYGFATGGNAVTKNGKVVYYFPGPSDVAFSQRDPGPLAPPPVVLRTEYGAVDYNVLLQPRARATFDFRMPVTPEIPGTVLSRRIAATSFATARGQVRGLWSSVLRPAFRLQVPEKKVVDTFYASLMHALLPRYRLGNGLWVQTVNKLRYHAFWLRDAAIMNQALLLAGLFGPARDNLPFFSTWQEPSGQFISRPGQQDGHGQALWSYGQYIRRTNDVGFARRVLPSVQRAVDWLEFTRQADPLKILPASDPRDNEVTFGRITGDNIWALAGLGQAVEIARRAGRMDLANLWLGYLTAYTAAFKAQATAAAGRVGGFLPPALDTPAGQDWGNYWAAYPAPVFSPRDPIVTATIQHARDEFAEGISTYDNERSLHHYLGYRILETELLRNDQANVIRGFYDGLAHTSATHGGFEAFLAPYTDRTIDRATIPHGWFAAEYITLLRNMLVREEGRGLVLMSALSPRWLRPGGPGERVSVTGAPTEFGRVSFTLRPTAEGATLTWSAPAGVALRWPVPASVTAVRAPGLRAGVITLPGRTGTLRVRWTRRRGPQESFDGAVRRLLADYARRGIRSVPSAQQPSLTPSDPAG